MHSWLGKIFSGDNVPPYEVNSQTVGLLYQLAQDCERKEAQSRIVLEDLEQKTREYAAESEFKM